MTPERWEEINRNALTLGLGQDLRKLADDAIKDRADLLLYVAQLSRQIHEATETAQKWRDKYYEDDDDGWGYW